MKRLSAADRYAYIGVYSSGLLGGPPAMSASEWETANARMLDNPSLKKGVKLLWFATGKDDGLITTPQATVDMLEKHGFTPVFKETPGGHTWINRRDYLNEFVPQLFQ